MVSVPQYNQQGVDKTPLEYSRVTPNADAFGAAVFQAKQNLSNSIAKINFDVHKIKDDIDTTRAMEYRNFIEKTKMKYLNDPEQGYFSKLGKNAMADPNDPDSGANGVVNAITRELEAKQQELGLTSGKGKQYADYFTASQLNGIILATGKHEKEQRLKWQEAVAQEAVDVSAQEMINNASTNPEQIDKEISNINAAVLFYGQQAGYDEETIRASQKKAVSHSLYLTIKDMASKDDIGAETLFEKYKKQLSPEYIAQLEPVIYNTKLNYQAREMAQNLLDLSEEEATKKINQISDIKLQERTRNFYHSLYNSEVNFKARGIAQNLMLLPEEQALIIINKIPDITLQERTRTFYQTFLREKDRLEKARIKEAEQASWDRVRASLDYNDIDYTSRPETISAQMSFINKMKELGRIETNYGIWQWLTDTATHNAEYFKNIDLNDYADQLTESELKHFKDLQNKVGSMDFTQIQDNNKIIEEAIKSENIGGHDKTKKVIYSEIRSLVREAELRKGRKLTDDEIRELAESLGYKGDDGIKTFKLVEQGMAEQVGFNKKITNDFEYFEKVHKRRPSAEEKYKIINQRVMEYKLEQNQQIKNQLENSTENQSLNQEIKAKKNETFTLTYFADVKIPQIAKNIGVNLKVTDRYREPNGKYKSYHSEGRAVDISYKTKEGRPLTLMQKTQLIESVISDPDVEAIAISTADGDGKAIMSHIKKKYGDKYSKKIQDMNKKDKNGKTRDQNLGTNHTTHIHITVKAGAKNTIANTNNNKVKIQTPDGRIVLVPQDKVNEAIKNGGVKL